MKTAIPQTNKKEKRQPWPKIRKVEHNNGSGAWLVDGRIAGKGERFFFKTKGEADTKAEQLRTSRKNEGVEGVALPAHLRAEAAKCAEKLALVGATLTEATEYFLKHAKPVAGAQTVAGVIETCLAAKKQAGRRPSHLRILGSVLEYFGKTFGKREIHTVGFPEISEWLLSQSWSLRTRRNRQNDYKTLFAFAMKHGYCAKNPMERLERIIIDEKPPGILTVEQAAALLNAAEKTEGGAMVPYVAIGLFAGLRASELAALEWSEISLSECTIEVCARKAKTRARRIVTMSESLAAWLKPRAEKTGLICASAGLHDRWQRVRMAAKIDPWPSNALRHSFASYHVAKHKNAPLTSLEMGHDNPNQLFASYRELVKPTDATRYWELRPRCCAEIDSVVAA